MLRIFKTWLGDLHKQKSALREDIDLSDVLGNTTPTRTNTPFSHIVFDDAFVHQAHASLRDYYTEVLSRGLSDGSDTSRFHSFVYNDGRSYDGFMYAPKYGENRYLDIMFSVTWNQYISRLFSQPTTLCTTIALHYHPPGDTTGFVHDDYSYRWFSAADTTPYRTIHTGRKVKPVVSPALVVRGITCIYYIDLKGAGWHDGDGGETGLYASPDDLPARRIEPLDNRLFVFQVSPSSYHAFQSNKTERATIIQWFHSEPEWCISRYGKEPEYN